MLIYLYVKRHKKTGLKYFGMTTQSNPRRYVGSGTRWNAHLKKHGRAIETLELWEFTDQGACTAFVLHFSKTNNIVESPEWANLIEENGVIGGCGVRFGPRSFVVCCPDK